jgi:hypothetical protein
MTNDDRKDEQPRYGERVSPEQGGAPRYEDQPTQQYQQQSAPQWGQHDQQQYGQQQYSQQQYSQQPQQYGNQQQAGAPAWNAHEEPTKKKKTVGVIAFGLGIVALVLGAVGGWLFGSGIASSGSFQELMRNGGSGTLDQQQMSQELLDDPAVMRAVGSSLLVLGIGTVVGLWALVQGIVAAATGRGRLWGILAIVLAVLAVVVLGIAYGASIAASVAGSQ